MCVTNAYVSIGMDELRQPLIRSRGDVRSPARGNSVPDAFWRTQRLIAVPSTKAPHDIIVQIELLSSCGLTDTHASDTCS
jgi:hypothetical protein